MFVYSYWINRRLSQISRTVHPFIDDNQSTSNDPTPHKITSIHHIQYVAVEGFLRYSFPEATLSSHLRRSLKLLLPNRESIFHNVGTVEANQTDDMFLESLITYFHKRTQLVDCSDAGSKIQ